MNCAGPCERPLVPRPFIGPLPLGYARVHCHERCGACYTALWRAGQEPPPRRTYYARDQLIEEVALLAQTERRGIDVARRLGITWEGLCRAHRRAGVPVPLPKDPDTVHFVTRKKDVSRGTATVRPEEPAAVA